MAQHQYDPATGTWKTTTTSSDSKGGGSSSSSPSPASSGGGGGGGENLKSSTGDNLSSAGTAEKEYNEIELNTLEGTLVVLPTEDTIKINAGDTIALDGLGMYLNGNYYVKDVTRSISSSGYQQTLTVLKTDYGKTLKSSAPSVEKKDPSTPASDESRQDISVSSPQTAEVQTPTRTYTVKKGDCLWNIAKQEYGSGTDWKKIYDANTGQVVNPNLIYPGQQLVIP